MRINTKASRLIFMVCITGLLLAKETFAGTGFGISNTFTLDTEGATPSVINASVSIKPTVINLKSKGKFTAFVEFPLEYDVSDVDENTIECAGAPAVKTRIFSKKYKFVSKFKIRDLKDVSAADSVTFLLTGNLITGETFEGSTIVKVINTGKKK